MKLFLIESKSVAFDEDSGMVILSSSSENALKLAKQNWKLRDVRKPELVATEINLSTEQIICISHYGN